MSTAPPNNSQATPTAASLSDGARATAGGVFDPAWNRGRGSPFFLEPIVTAIAVQDDGKVVLGGSQSFEPRFRPARIWVARLERDGVPDVTFGNGAPSRSFTNLSPDAAPLIPPSQRYEGGLAGVASLPDGGVVAVGAAGNGRHSRFGVVRYRDDGEHDPGFGTEGIVTTTFPGLDSSPAAVAVQHDGRIVVAGNAGADLALARYLPDGTLDREFGTFGRVVSDVTGLPERAMALTVDAQGRLLVAAAAHDPDTGADAIVVRYRPDGTLDTSFGLNGTAVATFGEGDDVATSIAVDAGGRIVTSGSAVTGDGPTDRLRSATVTRYLDSGKPDAGFAAGGRAVIPVAAGLLGNRTALSLLPDGRIAVVGCADSNQPRNMFVAIVDGSGALDTGFGSGGMLFASLSDPERVEKGAVVARQGRSLVIASGLGTGEGRRLGILAARLPVVTPVLTVTLSASPNPAGPGKVAFVATVVNRSKLPAGKVTLEFDVSKPIGPVVVSQGTSVPGARGGTATCSLGTIPPQGSATASTGTTVNGREEGLFASVRLTTPSLPPELVTTTASIEVLVSRFPTI